MGSGGVGFVACLGLSIGITALDATARPGLVLASLTLMVLAEAGLWLCVGLGVDPRTRPRESPCGSALSRLL